jgi:hypothetical protein
VNVDTGAPECTVRSAGALRPAEGEMLGRPLREWRAAMRAELGVPAGLVAGTGHQVEWWHPGIVAKFMWADAIAGRDGAAVLWLVVDTDVRDPRELRVPVETQGKLQAVTHRFGPRAAQGTPACRRDAHAPAPFEALRGVAIPASAAEGVRAAHDALLANAGAADCTEQVIGALRETTPAIGTPACTVRTSNLLQTALGAAIVAHAAADPVECARAFNAAVRLVPRVAQPLAEDGPLGAELPFWTMAADGTRARVSASELPALRERSAPLWPRAFLTSAIARAALCDRFVHGTGGGTYERATEAFAASWMGATLPAFDMATATLRLPFAPDDGPPPVTPAERRARWFDPESAHGAMSDRKRAALDAIARAPRASAERRAAWRAMHEQLARTRNAHACHFMELDARTAADRERTRAALLRADRTWAAVLHPQESLVRLAEAMRAQAHTRDA